MNPIAIILGLLFGALIAAPDNEEKEPQKTTRPAKEKTKKNEDEE